MNGGRIQKTATPGMTASSLVRRSGASIHAATPNAARMAKARSTGYANHDGLCR